MPSLSKIWFHLQSLAIKPFINKKEYNIIIVHINYLSLQVVMNNILRNTSKSQHHIFNEDSIIELNEGTEKEDNGREMIKK